MHVPIIFLEKVEKPLTQEELVSVKIYENDLYDQPTYHKAGFDYIGDEYLQFGIKSFVNIYDRNVLDLVEEDRIKNLFHIIKVKHNAVKFVSENKIKKINDFIKQIDSSNFKYRYHILENMAIEKFDTYIVEDNILYPLDEWILSEAEEDAMYQIVRVLDAHL